MMVVQDVVGGVQRPKTVEGAPSLLDVLGEALFLERVEWWAWRALLAKARGWLDATRVEQVEVILAEERVHTDALRGAIARAGGDADAVLGWAELEACRVGGLPAVIRAPETTFEEALALVGMVEVSAGECWRSLASLTESLDSADIGLRRAAARVAAQEREHFDAVHAWWRAARHA